MLSKKRLERVFKMFDKNGDGYIKLDEIKLQFGGDIYLDDSVW